MSNAIDQRVVEMQFDNRHFEQNVSTTMSTLDKLKRFLRLDGATKGLEDVNTAARNVDMNSLGNSAETVGTKFSALQVVAVTALANITNSAVNAGKRMIDALAVAPIRDGFSEYEMTLNAVQTTMAGTGKTAAEVQAELKKLDEYADKTVYSTADMLNNLPKFTNAGVALEDATKAMIGIANATALAGGDAGKASIAFYNLGQAIGTGYLTRMDYNSINNAGIATMEWKNQMVEAAIAAGTLKKVGEDSYQAGNKTLTLQQLFIDGLQEQWATTDVMMKVFGDYGDEQTKIGEKAYSAAQDIKTFTQMMESLKATAGTGWKDTWQIIFGDLDAAKELWTGLSEFISGFITRMADFRNGILEKVLGGGRDSKWNGISKVLENTGLSMGKLTDASRILNGANEKLTGSSDTLNKSLEHIGDYTVKKGDYLHKIAQKYGTTWQEIYNLNRDIIDDPDLIFPKQVLKMPDVLRESTTGAVEDITKSISGLSDEQLKNLGYTDDQIAAWRELEKVAKENEMTIEELLTELSKPRSGRDLLIESFANLGNTIMGVGTAIKSAWADIFGLPDMDGIAATIYNVIEALNRFTEKLRLTDEEGELNENGEKIQRTFRGIFAAIDIVLTLLGGPLKIVFKAFMQLLDVLDLNIFDITATIGDVIVAFRDWLDGVLDFTAIFEALVGPIKNALSAFRKWIDSLRESENLPQDIAKGIASGFGKAVKAVKDFFSNISTYISSGFESVSDSPVVAFLNRVRGWIGVAGQTIVELGKIVLEKVNGFLSAKGFKTISEDTIAGLVVGLKEGASKVWNAAVSVASMLVQKVKEFLGIHSPSTVMIAVGGFIIAGLVKGIIQGLPDVGGAAGDIVTTLKNIVSNIDLSSMFSAITTAGLVVGFNKIAESAKGFGEMMAGVGDLLSGVGKVLDKSARAIKKILKNTAKLINDFRKVVKGFANVLNSIAFETNTKGILNLAIAIAILAGSIIALSFIKPGKLWNAVVVIAVLAVIIGGLAIAISKMTSDAMVIDANAKTVTTSLNAGLLGIATVLLMMAVVVRMIGGMEPDKAKQGMTALIALLAGLVGFVVAFGLVSKFLGTGNMDKAAKLFSKFAVALAIMAIIIKLVGGMDPSHIKAGVQTLIALGGIITGLMAATKLITGSKHVDTIGGTLLKIALAIGVMALVVKLLGGMTPEALNQGTDAVLFFGGIIVGLMAATKLITGSKNIDTIGGTLLKIAVAIGVMALVVKLLGGMDSAALKQGMDAVAMFGGMIVGLMAATKLITGSKHVEKIGGTLLAISGAIAIMAFTALLLSMVSWDGFAKGIIMITTFGAMIIGLMAATKLIGDANNVAKIGGALLAMAGVIAILAVIAVLLGLVPEENLKKGLICVGLLSLMVAGLVAVTGLSKNCMGTIIAIAAALAVLAGTLITLSCLKPEKVVVAALALMGVLGVLAVVVAMTKLATGSLGVLVALSVALGLLGAVLIVLSNLPVKSVIGSAIALGGLMLVLTVVLAALSVIGNFAGPAIAGILALCAMTVPLALLSGVLVVMSLLKVSDAIPNVIALSLLCAALTLLLIPLTLIGALIYPALLGVLALTAMAVPLIAFVGVLAVMQNIQNADANTKLLIDLMTSMGDVLFKIAAVAPLAVVGVAAITALSSLAVGLVGILAILGGLSQIQGFNELIADGGETLSLVGTAIGKFVGSLVGGLMSGVVSTLPAIGLSLSEFMNNVTPFIEGAKLVNEQVLAGVGILAAAIIALTVADLIAGITTLLPCVGFLPSLGAQLSMFMVNALPFVTGAMMIKPEMLTGVKALADTILILTAANVIEGLTSWLTGGSSLANFAQQLPVLGSGLASFAANVGTFTEAQLATVNCAAQAIKTLAQASSDIPNTGGLLGAIVGENDLGTFADQFPVLGTGIANFLKNVGTFTEDQVATVSCAAEAIKLLAEASASIPNSGGWLGQIVGENDLGTFADQFPILGSGLAGFLRNVGTFTEDQVATVSCAADAIKTLAQASSEIPNSGGWLGQIVGENDLGTFADQFPILGSGLAGFLRNVGTFSDDQVATVDCAADAIKSLASVASSIPNSGGIWAKIVGDNDLGDFAGKFPKVGKGIKGFVNELGTFGSAQVSTVEAGIKAIDAMANLARTDLSGLKKNISGLGDKLKGFGTDIGKFCSNMPDAGPVNAAVHNLMKIIDCAENIANVNTGVFATLADNLGKVGEEAVKRFVSAFTSQAAKIDVKLHATLIASNAVDGFKANISAATDAGRDFGDGLVLGINSKQYAVYKAGYALGQKAVQGEKDGQKSKSPSRLTMQAGRWIGEGLVIGMQQMGDSVYAAGSDLGKTATGTISSTISRIADAVNSDIDAQPTIRPVLDLTDVRSGANALGNLLNSESSIGVVANAGRISGMMNGYSQNGVNADVVSAIDRLNKKMDNLGNTTYQVNGVTYDDGSNITDAVRSIVRAARIERRT